MPDALIEAMWASEASARSSARDSVELLKLEYAHFLDGNEALIEKLDCLAPLHGQSHHRKMAGVALARSWNELTASLLESTTTRRHTAPSTSTIPRGRARRSLDRQHQ